MKKNPTCCSCEADFENEVKGLVNEVDGYGKTDHEKKAAEVKAAFKSSAKKEEKAVKK